MHICRHCNTQFATGPKLGGHVSCCSLNPAAQKRHKRVQQTRADKAATNRFVLMSLCVKCDIEFEQRLTLAAFEKRRYRKHCSYACSNSRVQTTAANQKRAQSLRRNVLSQKSPRRTKFVACSICGSLTEQFLRSHRKTCGQRECVNRVISQAVTGRTGGYRTCSGTSKFKGCWHSDAWLDSSWELALAKRLDALNVGWERDIKSFSYTTIAGKQRRYYPDFYLPAFDMYLEVKGYWTPESRWKLVEVVANHPVKLIVLDSISAIGAFRAEQYA